MGTKQANAMSVGSYTSASTLPVKILSNPYLMNQFRTRILPVHVQINPTNQCPLKCSFCSCKNRDRSLEMSYDMATEISDSFINYGAKAFTITGGGDPLAWHHINTYVDYLFRKGMKTGLVTDGVMLKSLKDCTISKLTWCRISMSLEYMAPKHIMTDYLCRDLNWSVSYVVTGNDAKEHARNLSFILSRYGKRLSHIRVVEDILDPGSVDIAKVKSAMTKEYANDSILIWQGRKQSNKGHRRCLASLLKPNIAPNGMILPCCGIQYASKEPSLDFDKRFCMGFAPESVYKVWTDQKYFNGSKCAKCYYSDYNNVLNAIYKTKYDHEEFV